uniref:Peptidase C1A papain C-terminal domain-containing protein n=1 Tax=Tetradesmus obliquus TaxID=3088 RepID=A0A383W9S6_TETOB|eukprot:jgi/Sobl393_1/4887/SZX73849.1
MFILALIPYQVPHSSSGIRLASGQGLSVSADNLGAGAEATANEFEQFESALELATTGGRGRGGRGSNNNLGGFSNPKSFATMQTAMYYIAGSPQVYDSSNPRHTPGGLNYVGAVNDQKLCSTCVAQAITKAVQMSIAATLRNSSGQFAVSPQAFYYCAPPGGRSCKTGWDIPEALKAMTENPQWVVPSSCFNTAKLLKGQDEADVGEWSSICSAAAASATPACAAITKQQPLFRCSFKSLSSFYQIEQHIRAHGAVVTRMVVNNDFEVQFNASAKTKSGLSLPPYRYNVTARPSFAHAALITGYDNNNYTWTLLNSWGKGRDAGQLRASGVTADGLFRMQMGLAGVGTPDATYAVSCYPAEGTPLHPNHEQPWARSRRRPLTPESSEVLLSNTCYRYTIREGDTVASIVDHFGLDMRQFVQDKVNLRSGVVGDVTSFKYAFGSTLKEDQLRIALDTADKVTSVYSTVKPFVQCSLYDAGGSRGNVRRGGVLNDLS